MKDLYNENYKTLETEIEEKIRKEKLMEQLVFSKIDF